MHIGIKTGIKSRMYYYKHYCQVRPKSQSGWLDCQGGMMTKTQAYTDNAAPNQYASHLIPLPILKIHLREGLVVCLGPASIYSICICKINTK